MKKLIRKLFTSFRKLTIGTILYRDLAIVRAIPNYPATNRLFFGKQIAVSISEPDYSCSEISLQFEERLGVYAPVRKYCDTFDNALILGGAFPMVFNAEYRPLWNAISYSFFDFDRYYTPAKWFLQRKANSQWIDLEYAIFLNSTWYSNYFHWLLDNLARLQCIDFLDRPIRDKVTIVVNKKLSDFQVKSLTALGFNNIEYVDDRNYRIKHLLVPSFPLEQQGYDLDQLLWLKNKILQSLTIKSNNLELCAPNILILRKPSAGRAFTNQDKLLEALIPLGFKDFYLEDLPFEHQIELFEQARFIVASHGAGLTNIIFAKTASIIEIFAEQTLPCYFQLAKTLGLGYGFLVCKSKTTGHEGDQKNQNLEVDISQLIQIIQKMHVSVGSTNTDR
jgi:hypothetical protein